MINAGKKQATERPFAAMDLSSPCEREVLAAVASGRTNRETGEMLGINHGTVEVHRARLMRKLRMQSAAQLVALYVLYGSRTAAVAGRRIEEDRLPVLQGATGPGAGAPRIIPNAVRQGLWDHGGRATR